MAESSISKMQILLIEDSPLLRRLLTETLEEIEGVEVCGFAETENEALGSGRIHIGLIFLSGPHSSGRPTAFKSTLKTPAEV